MTIIFGPFEIFMRWKMCSQVLLCKLVHVVSVQLYGKIFWLNFAQSATISDSLLHFSHPNIAFGDVCIEKRK